MEQEGEGKALSKAVNAGAGSEHSLEVGTQMVTVP